MWFSKLKTRVVFNCLFVCCFKIRLRQFAHVETSLLSKKGFKMYAYDLHLRTLGREGSASCHTCWDTGPRILRSHPKDLLNLVAFYECPFANMWIIFLCLLMFYSVIFFLLVRLRKKQFSFWNIFESLKSWSFRHFLSLWTSEAWASFSSLKTQRRATTSLRQQCTLTPLWVCSFRCLLSWWRCPFCVTFYVTIQTDKMTIVKMYPCCWYLFTHCLWNINLPDK